ncbi:unnamed protein product [Paramecium octaurelia]|uniref:PSI domain-containing protein n=1 Tax=Paramecium octaurelia TaxID=43137 RepID=A0A8S1YEA8_PAROT|nr:unnamed protein product [Paramecium octaurelia]
MKAYILIAIFISLGASQVQVTSQTICGCTQLTNQNDCNTLPGCQWTNNSCSQQSCLSLNQSSCLKASQYCQWNLTADTPSCSSFDSCENLVATNNQQCIQQNVRCLGFSTKSQQCLYYNQITSNCIDFPQAVCSYNFGKDGPCYWTNNNCQVINNCSMATKQDQCLQLNYFKSEYPQGIVCQWNQATMQCQAITNCNQFPSQNTCKHYFASLNSITLNVCYWSLNTTPPSCVPVTNLNNLTSQNCLLNTGLLFRWYGQQNNPNQGFCGPCKQVELITRTQCTCSDYVLQTDCNSQNSLCQWNTGTQICTLNTCSNILTQDVCITVSGCYWNFNTYSCQTLNNCTDLTFKVSAIGCAAQSLQCAGYIGGTCNSTSAIVSTCSNQSNQESCSQFISNQGLCIWNVSNSSCSLLQYCSQITDAPVCGSWQNQCTWNALISQCQQMTCAMITNQQKCTYVLTQFQQTQYQLCRWDNSIGIQGACENAYSALLQTSQTCVNATGNTFRWSTNNASAGMCVSCGINQLSVQTPSSCQCQQFQSQDNCTNSGFCTFNKTSNICQPSPCTSFENQITCALLSNCYWNSNYCVQFTSCSDLPPAANQLECVSMNASCKGISNKICQSYPTSTCSAMYIANGSCYNNIGTDGVCLLSNTDQITQCIGFSQCALAQNPTLCLRNQFSCQWNTVKNQCSQITCASFLTELNCKFYLPNPLSSEIIPCYWNTSNHTCVIADDILTTLNQNTCALNTYNTYRWVSIQQGYCVKCQEQVTLPNQCDCTFLSQYDCSQAFECYWNNSYCQQLECPQILQKNICASQLGCMWNNNQCQVFNGQCGNLLGSSQYQCMAQNVYCVGSNGTQCTKSLHNCKENTQQASCISTALGRDGVCFWSNQYQKCVAYYACNQLPESECRFSSKSCYWDQTNCQTLTCSALFQQFGYCTYVISLTSINNIQACKLINNQCASLQDPFALSSDQCFRNTNKTARWIPRQNGNGGICYSCSANLVPLYSPTICQCYQYTTQNDCLQSPRSCFWDNDTCMVQSCANIYTNQACAQTLGCGWSNGVCENFTSCNSISGLGINIENCLSYSIQCKGYNGQTCTQYPDDTCSVQQTPSNCNGNFGSDGPCLWNLAGKGSCYAISICSDILNPKICSYYKNLCVLVNDQCEQLTCAQFKSPASCKYVVSSFLTGELQLCQWSTVSQTCINFITPSSLNSMTCSVNTGYTYRWIQNNNTDGYCTKCLLKSLYVPGQCACNQLIYENDCLSNPFCSYSTAQNTPSCYNKPCSEIILQEMCSSNPRCSWSATQELCQPFTKCSDLVGINQGECASYSYFCAATTQAYSPLQDKYFCAQTPTQCKTGSGTSSANQYQKCVAYYACNQLPESECRFSSKSCYWDQTNCQTLTCSALFQQFGYCTYVISLTSINNIQACKLINNQCASLQDPFALSSDQCFRNTNKTARWIPRQNGNGGICYSCSANLVPLYSPTICQCYQYTTQNDCLQSPRSCFWDNDTCMVQSCANIYTNQACAQTLGCGWSNGVCENFTSCNSISGLGINIENCLSYSIQCKGYNGQTCTQYPDDTCSVQQTPSNCNGNFGSDGPCLWNLAGKGSCYAISICSDILNPKICSYYKNLCVLVNDQCEQLTCAQFKSPASCKYVVSSFLTGELQLCQWSTVSQTCINFITPSSLNSMTCSVNTGYTYRWIQNNNTDGYCTKCLLKSLYVPGQCACNQLIYENDCLSNPFCSYSTAQNTPSCYNKPCSEIILQEMCSSNPRCSWSATQELCQPFTKCSDLVGINQGECASYSYFCAATTQAYSPLQDKYFCAQTPTQCKTGSGTSSASQCENTITQNGICQFNTKTNQCTLATNCSDITSQIRCQELIHSCYWQQPTGQTTQGSCITTNCNIINNQLECTYVLTTLSSTTPSSSNVIQCQWSPTVGCQTAKNIFSTFNSTNCYTNTFMLSRWASTSTDSGHCITCGQYATSQSFDSFCLCEELSESECQYASPQCSYNSASSKCAIQNCSSITSKYECAANQNCIYIGSTCYTYSSKPSQTAAGCKNITNPKYPFECYTASINCPVFTLNASHNSNSTNNCSAPTQCRYLNHTECQIYNSEICVWNANNQKCKTVDNCNQITDVALCSLQTSRCQWSVVFNSCITQSCNSYTSQSDCTYVYTSYSPGDIALCFWDSSQNECKSAPSSNATSYTQTTFQCFVNTGHVYHYDGNQCKMCFETVLNILLITILLLLI